MHVVEYLLNISGIGQDRLTLCWVSAAEGKLFADYVTRFSETIRQLMPFNPEQHKIQLEAVEKALGAPRLRWLIGMESTVTEKENVYKETIGKKEYQDLVMQNCEAEYYRAVILEILKEGPQSAREIAFKSGLPLYTVSLRLNDLERWHQAEFVDYDGNTARFSCTYG